MQVVPTAVQLSQKPQFVNPRETAHGSVVGQDHTVVNPPLTLARSNLCKVSELNLSRFFFMDSPDRQALVYLTSS